MSLSNNFHLYQCDGWENVINAFRELWHFEIDIAHVILCFNIA